MAHSMSCADITGTRICTHARWSRKCLGRSACMARDQGERSPASEVYLHWRTQRQRCNLTVLEACAETRDERACVRAYIWALHAAYIHICMTYRVRDGRHEACRIGWNVSLRLAFSLPLC
eukprot:366436-Chlamydomonas_euryale.AAC.28